MWRKKNFCLVWQKIFLKRYEKFLRPNSPCRERVSWESHLSLAIFTGIFSESSAYRELTLHIAAFYCTILLFDETSGLTNWFWYAVTAVKMASGKINVLCSSFCRSVMCKLLSSVCRQRTKCILGWYLCIEFNTICNNEEICVRLLLFPTGLSAKNWFRVFF